jgi:hypothetical protein
MRALLFCLALAASGCAGEESQQMDMGVHFDMTFASQCGWPGDEGNALGVGRYCDATGDQCSGLKAAFCTNLFVSDEHFCTFSCHAPADGGADDECGSGAHCACSGMGCGCYPDACS